MIQSMETISVHTSQTPFLSELATESETIPPSRLSYFQERLRNNLYSHILRRFREREVDGFTKAALARRIGYDPARVTKLLGGPGNWTIDTISDLLLGIGAEELIPTSEPVLGRPPRNDRGQSWQKREATDTDAEVTVAPPSRTFDWAELRA